MLRLKVPIWKSSNQNHLLKNKEFCREDGLDDLAKILFHFATGYIETLINFK